MGNIFSRAQRVVDWEFDCPGSQNRGSYGDMHVYRQAGYGVYAYGPKGITIQWRGNVVYAHSDEVGVVKSHWDSCLDEHLNKMVAIQEKQIHYRQRRHQRHR